MYQHYFVEDLNTKAIFDYKYETEFVGDMFTVCRKLSENFVKIELTLKDLPYARFAEIYHIEFFGYASKFTGLFVCSKTEPYSSYKMNVSFAKIIPLAEE